MTFTRTHSRATDPDTSYQAANTAEPRAMSNKEIVRVTLMGPCGGYATAEEIAKFTAERGINRYEVNRRLADLEDPSKNDGIQVVRKTEVRRPNKAGNSCVVWELVR